MDFGRFFACPLYLTVASPVFAAKRSFVGDDALRAVFPSIVLRPRCSAPRPV